MVPIDLTDKTVSVLDAHGILYQVFHSIQKMSTSRGEPTGAVFGFVRDLMTLLAKVRADYLFCAFDMPGKTFRHDLYSAYKANRQAMPDDLRPQIGYVRDFLPAFGIMPLGLAGFEADDILATIAALTEEGNGKAVLVTADKDARQLISNQTSLYNLRKQQFYSFDDLKTDWGITPEQVVDFQTMVGDSTDNIPGIPLIGPKSAGELLVKFGSLENIFQHMDELKGKKKENIASSQQTVALSSQLVRLDRSVPIQPDWENARFHGVDPDRLTAMFKYFDFRSLLPKIKELTETYGTIHCETPLPDYVLATGFHAAISETSTASPTLFDNELFDETMPLFAHAQQESRRMALNEHAASNPDGEISLPVPEEEMNPPAFPIRPYRFASLLDSVAATLTPSPFPEKDVSYHAVDTPEKFDSFMSLLESQKVFSIDLETTNKQPRFAKIVGLAFCFNSHETWYLPVRGPLGSDLLPEETTLARLRPILESPEIAKIGQNIKYDMIVFRNMGIRLTGVVFDTMVADYLLRAGERNHNLDDMADFYLGHETIKISELIGTGKNQKSMDTVPVEAVAEYAGEDALIPWLLLPVLYNRLRNTPKLLKLYTDLELPLIDTLVEMEYGGIAIAPHYFHSIESQFQARLDELADVIHGMVREVDPDPEFAKQFNLNSPKQLQRILFDDLKLPVIRKTKTGRSTDIDVLEELARVHPLPEKIIEHRQITKLQGTYVVPLPQLLHPETDRIHASFNQVVTATGRLSSSDPNLQNIPIRTEEGKLIRTGFIPDHSLGFDTLVSCDYSQIELRMLAHFSRDEHMQSAFQADEDIHTHVASRIFDVPPESVTSEMRRKAKAVNFGLIYGQSAFGLSNAIDISREEAAAYIHSFFETYPGIQAFFDRILNNCYRNGFVETILGRRRRIEGVREKRNPNQLNMPERTAINTVIQGSAADLMKLAMVNVHSRLYETDKTAPEKTRLLLQIHDELVFETSESFAPDLANRVRQEMELGQPLSVPLKIDIETGPNWGNLK